MIDQEHLYMEHISKDDGKKDYTIYHVKAGEMEGCNFDCMVVVPANIKGNARIVVKCHNTGSPSQKTPQSIEENMQIAENPIDGTYQYINNENDILMVPLIIYKLDGEYHQQLTRGALLDNTPGYERVDIQVINAINSIKEKLMNEDGIDTEGKIDLVGFSAAGGFAQRFMLLHPEIIRAIYAGGAMDGIPLPIEELNGQKLNYPLGIADYEEITGHKFNMEAFRQISVRFSYGEKEREILSDHYFDDMGNPVSNFDMSYIGSITPEEEGKIMREAIGRTPEDRFIKTVEIYKSLGIDIETEVYPELGHRENSKSKQAVRDFFKRIDDKEKANTKGHSYQQVRDVLKKILSVPELQDKLIISGGIVPYVVADKDSERLHSDIDIICKQEYMATVRDMLKRFGLYHTELDSLSYSCTNGLDYGVDTTISGVPVGFYPYEIKNSKKLDGSKLVDTDMIVQRTFTPPCESGKMPELKVKEIPDLSECDYYAESHIDGIPFKHTSLELIKATKLLALKSDWRAEKDLKDIVQIDSIGIDEEKQKRVDDAVKNMHSTMNRKNNDEQSNCQEKQIQSIER